MMGGLGAVPDASTMSAYPGVVLANDPRNGGYHLLMKNNVSVVTANGELLTSSQKTFLTAPSLEKPSFYLTRLGRVVRMCILDGREIGLMGIGRRVEFTGMIPPYRVNLVEGNDNVPFAQDIRLAA